MSGLFAVFNRSGAPVNEADLARALGRMSVRGRDDSRMWHQSNAGLAAAVTFWSSEEKPCDLPFTLDGSCHVIAAALLSNRPELRRQLHGAGHATTPETSDAELILRSYTAWGERCTEHLRGEFAAVVWDPARQKLLGFVDHFGTLPLFYTDTSEMAVLSTDLEAIATFRGVDRTLSPEAIVDTLIYGFQQSRSSTIYEHIHRLPGGHLLEVAPEKARRSVYWTPDEWSPLRNVSDPQSLVDEFHAHLERAVLARARLPNLGVELSGGLDTSSIAQVLSEDARNRRPQRHLRAFCHGFSGPAGEAEPALARQTADHLGLDLEVLWQDRGHPLGTTKPSHFPPEPQGFLWDAGLLHGRNAAAHSPILFSGHGGDMILGYVEYHWMRQLRRRPMGAFRDLLTFFRMYGFKRPPLGLRNWVRKWQGANESNMPVPTWLRQDLVDRVAPLDRVTHIETRSESFRQRLGMWHSPVSSMIFSRTDAAYYDAPIRCVYPYFDFDLWEFLQSVPPIPYFVKKALLRVDMKHRLPTAVVTRPKVHLADASHPILESMQISGVPAWYFEQLKSPCLDAYVDGRSVARRLEQIERVGKAEFLQCVGAVHLGAWLEHRAASSAAKNTCR